MRRFNGTSKFFFYCAIVIAVSAVFQILKGYWGVAVFMFVIAAAELGLAYWVSGKEVAG